MKAMSDLGVTVILDERLDLSTVADSQKKGAERVVKTLKGREIAAELVVRYPLISLYHHTLTIVMSPTRCFAQVKFLILPLSARWTRVSFDRIVVLLVC